MPLFIFFFETTHEYGTNYTLVSGSEEDAWKRLCDHIEKAEGKRPELEHLKCQFNVVIQSIDSIIQTEYQ